MASLTHVSGIKRKMLINFFFFAESPVHHRDTMVNKIPLWIGKDMRCGDDKAHPLKLVIPSYSLS
jgi:hypothetical protein